MIGALVRHKGMKTVGSLRRYTEAHAARGRQKQLPLAAHFAIMTHARGRPKRYLVNGTVKSQTRLNRG